MRVTAVFLWYTIGSPCGPSKQSSSTQRQPIRRTRRYMSADEAELSWLPVTYVLWEEAMK